MQPELLVDYAAIRLLGMAAHNEDQVRAGNPAFTVHRDHQFAAGRGEGRSGREHRYPAGL